MKILYKLFVISIIIFLNIFSSFVHSAQQKTQSNSIIPSSKYVQMPVASLEEIKKGAEESLSINNLLRTKLNRLQLSNFFEIHKALQKRIPITDLVKIVEGYIDDNVEHNKDWVCDKLFNLNSECEYIKTRFVLPYSKNELLICDSEGNINILNTKLNILRPFVEKNYGPINSIFLLKESGLLIICLDCAEMVFFDSKTGELLYKKSFPFLKNEQNIKMGLPEYINFIGELYDDKLFMSCTNGASCIYDSSSGLFIDAYTNNIHYSILPCLLGDNVIYYSQKKENICKLKILDFGFHEIVFTNMDPSNSFLVGNRVISFNRLDDEKFLVVNYNFGNTVINSSIKVFSLRSEQINSVKSILIPGKILKTHVMRSGKVACLMNSEDYSINIDIWDLDLGKCVSTIFRPKGKIQPISNGFYADELILTELEDESLVVMSEDNQIEIWLQSYNPEGSNNVVKEEVIDSEFSKCCVVM